MDTLLEHPAQAPAQQRLAWADLLRVLATFAVVVLHTSTTWLGGAAEGSSVQQILLVWDGLMRWCVPVFVMLSGAFLLDPGKALSPKSLFLGRLPRILVSLAVWGLFYNLILFGRTDGRFTWEGIRTALVLLSRGQTQYHLWFLVMILGLYLVTPVLRGLVRGCGRREIEWLLVLWFAAGLLAPAVLSYFPSMGGYHWLRLLDLPLVGGYLGYYVAGYYLRTYVLPQPARAAVYALGAAGTAVTLVLGEGAFGYLTPNVACTAVALFLLFRQLFRPGRFRLGWAVSLSRYSFGIYLSHVFFLMLLTHFGLHTLPITPVLLVPALSLLAFLGALAATWLLKKLPVAGTYIT